MKGSAMAVWIMFVHPTDSPNTPELYEVNRLVDEANRRGMELSVLKPSRLELLVTANGAESIRLDGEPVTPPHVCLPRMGTETTCFAFAVLRQLERMGVPTINRARAIDIVKDKLRSHQMLAAAGLPIPTTMLAKFPVDVEAVEQAIGFPLVVKTLSGTQGNGVFLCEGRRQFEDLIALIHATQSGANLILQQFISDSRGRDVRALVVGGRIIAAMERQAVGDNFKSNYSQGGTVKPVKLNREAEWIVLEAARTLELDIAGVDLLYDGDSYRICEANSSPGFQGIESCCDVDVAEEIFDFISLRLMGWGATRNAIGPLFKHAQKPKEEETLFDELPADAIVPDPEAAIDTALDKTAPKAQGKAQANGSDKVTEKGSSGKAKAPIPAEAPTESH